MLVEYEPDLVLLDMRLPDGSGLDFLAKLRKGPHRDTAVVVLTAFGALEDAVAAMKHGALDYLKKPIDLDELVLTIEQAFARIALAQKLEYSKERESHSVSEVELLGESSVVATLRQHIRRIHALTDNAQGPSPPTVLILGETGTGKDITAKALHDGSARAERPFVHIDCAGLPKDLIEAELFGHAKGAFTDARTERTGLVEAAEDGTVFFDEIGELPLELQAKLLATLERRVVRRVGSNREYTSNAWFIAATNRDLADMVAQGAFRSDLFFRLQVLTLSMPPLRERGADAVLLARHFAARTAKRYGMAAPAFTEQAVEAIERYSWPGNVRELKNLVERAVLLSAGEAITPNALSLSDQAAAQTQAGNALALEGLTLEQAEIALIHSALKATHGNVSKTARQLGITRMALRYRLEKYQIDPKG